MPVAVVYFEPVAMVTLWTDQQFYARWIHLFNPARKTTIRSLPIAYIFFYSARRIRARKNLLELNASVQLTVFFVDVLFQSQVIVFVVTACVEFVKRESSPQHTPLSSARGLFFHSCFSWITAYIRSWPKNCACAATISQEIEVDQLASK